jgi:hypothetical protein
MSQPEDEPGDRKGSTPEAPRPSIASEEAIPAIRHAGALVPFVYERLRKALGTSKGAEVMRQVLTSFANRPVETPQDLLEFAERLLRLGRLTQAVGRSLKVDAILRGATER